MDSDLIRSDQMSGGPCLVLGPNKRQRSAVLVVEVGQPGDDGKEDDGEEEQDKAWIFLAGRVEDLGS